MIEDQLEFELDVGKGVATVTCHTDRRNPEVFEPNRAQGNPIARPDIIVSRIDAHGAAYSVDASRTDATGRHFVDAQGRPQTVGAEIAPAPPTQAHQLIPDAALERQLMLAYFDRNHRHRTTPAAEDRVVSVSSGDFAGQAAIHAQDLASVLGTGQPAIVLDAATLDQYAGSWDMQTSIRAFHAHSTGENSHFPGANVQQLGYDARALEQLVGSPFYRWHHDTGGGTYEPGIEGQGDWADFWLHRSMWQARPAPPSSSLVVHYGCNTPSSPGTAHHPYPHPQFAACRLSSCLLFYTDAVLMFGRTKVYLDAPVGFLEPLREGGTAGDAWVRLYDEAGDNARLAEFANWVDAKIAYSWALVGDWTLKRRY